MKAIRLSRRSMQQFGLLVFAVVFVTSLASASLVKPASALAGSDFNPARIIDDGVFENSSAMSVTDIQNFLVSKVPTCDTNGTQLTTHANGSGGFYTRAQWGAANGNPTPFTCLKDFVENTTTLANNFSNPGAAVPGGISAAQIIWNAAQAYRINPQVLLVTLQKEQGLVTDDWPWIGEFSYAMGYACPDTAACSGTYADFYKQIDGSAWQYRYYLDHPNAFNYWIGSNFIQYSPNASCGGSIVNIQNAATAALYIYTPYQPNAAALSKLTSSTAGGTGDSCSAYGNRNFWWYFNTWFGSSMAPTYGWQNVGQYAYTDQTKTTGASMQNMLPGTRVYVGLRALNTGNTTWSNTGANPIKLGTSSPLDRNSPFCDATWTYGCNRPATMLESSVAPGQIGTFEFWMKAPSTPGTYPERFDLVIEGKAWLPDIGTNFFSTVTPPTYSWQFLGQYAYGDQAKTTGRGTTNLLPGDRVFVGFTARNTGNMTWTKTGSNPVHVGMTYPLDRASPFYDASWLGTNRPGGMVQDSVAPGQIGNFEFWMKAPANYGTYVEHYSLVAEGAAWMNDPGMNFYMSVSQPVYAWQITGQYAYSDQTKTVGKGTTGLHAGDRVYVGFTAKNTGNTTWKNNGANPINVGMTHPLDRASPFYDASWLGTNRPTHMVEASVAPGQTGTFEFWMKAPATPGVYREYYDLVSEGAAWFTDPNLNFYMSVQ